MSTSSDRFAARIRERRHRPWRLAVAVVALVAMAAGAGWIVLASPVLAVHRVVVTGTDAIPAAQVMSAAGVRDGTPLARLDTSGIAARIRELPRVESVGVVRRWPRTVALVVEERVPLAAMRQGTSYAVVDRQGVVLTSRARAPKGLPVVQAMGESPPRSLSAALGVLSSLPDFLRGQVETITASGTDDVTLQLAHGRTVVWGDVDRSSRKAAVLAALMNTDASTFDVSAPDVPTTR